MCSAVSVQWVCAGSAVRAVSVQWVCKGIVMDVQCSECAMGEHWVCNECAHSV